MTVAASKSTKREYSGIFANLNNFWQDYRLYRQTVKELTNLSDRELADLNISRWDIDRIARQAVESR